MCHRIACFASLVVVLLLAPTRTRAAAKSPESPLLPTRLRAEYRDSPLGIDARRPRLSWVLAPASTAPELRGRGQAAYRIVAASNPSVLAADRGDLWDSGRVAGKDAIHIAYKGKVLASGQRVHWKVRVWDDTGALSRFSEPAWFEMALLAPADWKAAWIDDHRDSVMTEGDLWKAWPAPLFRKEFPVAKKIARARAYASGLGYYELSLNGRRVGDHVLDPGWTSYGKRVLYSTYDVTELLQPGANAVGVMAGNGWWNALPLRLFGRINLRDVLATGWPCVIVQLDIEYTDGSREQVVTDPTWKVGDSGLQKNSIYLGELFDARKHPSGWDRAGFDDGKWRTAKAAQAYVGPLVAQDAPPIKVTRTLKPVAVTEPKPGVFVFDMGQNFAGWITLRAQGKAGTRMSLRYAELLYPDGMPNGMTTFAGQIKTRTDADREAQPLESDKPPATAWQQDVFILKGDGGVESFTPRFTFHGFRYVAVEGYPGKPTVDALEGQRLNSAVESAGSFSSGSELFGRIQTMVEWTLLSNLFSVQSDCPQRERLGYGGDIVAASEMAILNFDMSRFYAKAVRDLQDAVRPNGGFTETSPFVGIETQGLGGGSGPVGWGIAHPVLLNDLYRYYGDRALLDEQYGTLVRYTEFLRSKAEGHIIEKEISDHEMLGERPRALTATAFYFHDVRLTADLAHALGKTADEKKYRALGRDIAAAFNKKFLPDAKAGRYDAGNQTCQAFALHLGLVPAASRRAAFNVLIDDIVNKRDGHLTTGIFGTKYMLNLLSDAGRADVGGRIVSQTTFPSWGHMLENGATTLWEAWKKDERTYSHNHPMFGSVSEWFWKTVAGIAPGDGAVGFDRIRLRPAVLDGVPWAKGRYHSVRGDIVSEWRVEGGAFLWDVTVPVGATAVVHVPAKSAAQVKEGEVAATRARGLRYLRMESGAAVFEAKAGSYRFGSAR